MRYLTALLLLAPAAALAGGYAIPNENARDLALSQATVAAQNGPEAAHTNPSALAGQKGFAITGNIEVLINDTTWSVPGGSASFPTAQSASLQPHANTPPQVAAAYGNALPNGMAYGVGLSVSVPGGGALPWPANWPGAARIQEVEQKVRLGELGGGIQLHPLVKLGASLLYYRVTEKLTIGFPLFGGTGALGDAAGAFTYGLSGEFKAPADIPLTFAIAYRHQAPMTLTGDAHFTNVPPSFATQLQDQGASHRIVVPNDLYVGAAYDVLPNVKVMGSWNLERWRVYDADTFVGDRGLVLTVPRNYRNAWVFRVGGEYTNPSFLPKLTLRVGGLRSVSNQPRDTISPTLTDASSWAFSLGAGYEFIPGLRGDIGYQYAIFDKVTAEGPDAFPGTYDTHVHLVSAGVTFRLPNL